MRTSLNRIASTAVLVAILGVGVTACSSAEDAKAAASASAAASKSAHDSQIADIRATVGSFLNAVKANAATGKSTTAADFEGSYRAPLSYISRKSVTDDNAKTMINAFQSVYQKDQKLSFEVPDEALKLQSNGSVTVGSADLLVIGDGTMTKYGSKIGTFTVSKEDDKWLITSFSKDAS